MIDPSYIFMIVERVHQEIDLGPPRWLALLRRGDLKDITAAIVIDAGASSVIDAWAAFLTDAETDTCLGVTCVHGLGAVGGPNTRHR